MHDHTYFFYEERHFDVNTFPLPVTLSFTGAEMDVPARGWVVFFGVKLFPRGSSLKMTLFQFGESSFYVYKNYMII